jgi:hypothetical protein
MRRLATAIRYLLLGVLVLVIGLASPVVYVETMCRGDATPAPSAPLAEETRPEIRTLLTYPEWHIVHAYDDYAEVIRTGDPHAFGFLRAIGGYWGSLCTLTRQSAELGTIDGATRQLVHVIGVSFTLEMLMKAAYEETLGRAVAWARGPERSALDDLSAQQAAAYAVFLQQVPWYRYDFRADARALARASQGGLRDTERALALGLEHRARAAYAGLIGRAVAATGQDDLTLQMVVAGLPAARLQSTQGVTLLRETGGGIEVETPRYRALTLILADWARAGAEFLDIAGNDQIMFTALSDRPQAGGALLSMARQGHGDWRHLFLVRVKDLADRLRGLEAEGLRLEHVHDY